MRDPSCIPASANGIFTRRRRGLQGDAVLRPTTSRTAASLPLTDRVCCQQKTECRSSESLTLFRSIVFTQKAQTNELDGADARSLVHSGIRERHFHAEARRVTGRRSTVSGTSTTAGILPLTDRVCCQQKTDKGCAEWRRYPVRSIRRLCASARLRVCASAPLSVCASAPFSASLRELRESCASDAGVIARLRLPVRSSAPSAQIICAFCAKNIAGIPKRSGMPAEKKPGQSC